MMMMKITRFPIVLAVGTLFFSCLSNTHQAFAAEQVPFSVVDSNNTDTAPLLSPSLLGCESCTSCSFALDPCQVNRPGGLMLLTQFWDFSPPIGPSDSWTIHGLWPDLCDGRYEASCDNSRSRSGYQISNILAKTDAKTEEILDKMNMFWLALNGNDAQLWSHEWNKHATCISTLAPKCYTASSTAGETMQTNTYTQDQDVIDFFNVTTSLFASYNVFATLSDHGIVPSTSATYTLQDLNNAAQDTWGNSISWRCKNGGNQLNEAWVYFHTIGRATTTENFVITDPLPSNTNCPAQGIRYLPK